MEEMNFNIKSRRRKHHNKQGEATQKMVSFRCDLYNFEWLQQVGNKGRYINRLIQDDRLQRQAAE